jgi:hypothetical protein
MPSAVRSGIRNSKPRYPDVRHHRVEDALRAKIILYAAAGLWNEEISQRTLRRLPAIAARAPSENKRQASAQRSFPQGLAVPNESLTCLLWACRATLSAATTRRDLA